MLVALPNKSFHKMAIGPGEYELGEFPPDREEEDLWDDEDEGVSETSFGGDWDDWDPISPGMDKKNSKRK